MTLRLPDEATEEMRQSALWYEDKNPGLGDEFLDAVERALETIEEHPHRFLRITTKEPDREIRRCVPRRFPFLTVYEIRTDEVLVVAVAHGKRKPRYWENRL